MPNGVFMLVVGLSCVADGATYLSDLRCAPVDAAQLGRILSAIQPQRFTEREWLDACEYITGRKAGSSVEAREFLFCFAAKRTA